MDQHAATFYTFPGALHWEQEASSHEGPPQLLPCFVLPVPGLYTVAQVLFASGLFPRRAEIDLSVTPFQPAECDASV